MPAVKPIPDGYHTVTPYLIVGDGDAAIAFYAKRVRRGRAHAAHRRPTAGSATPS